MSKNYCIYKSIAQKIIPQLDEFISKTRVECAFLLQSHRIQLQKAINEAPQKSRISGWNDSAMITDKLKRKINTEL